LIQEKSIYVFVSIDNAWVPAGLLHCHLENNRVVASAFRYGTKYLQNKKAYPVDISSLPLSDQQYKTDPRMQIFSGLIDSAPDSWGRALMERRAGKPLREDEFLTASSDQRVGALAFSDSPDRPRRITPWSKDQEDDSVLDLEPVLQAYLNYTAGDQNKIDEAMRQYILPGSPMGGARPKAVVLFEQRLWMAKFQKENDPFDFIRCEYACMELARKCGLNVPKVKIEKFNERSVFLIERFDRHEQQRFHLNSFFSILQQTETGFMHSSYMEMAEALLKHSRKDVEDRLELFGRMIFNGLCRNTDDHLRNHAMLYSPKLKSFHLSPLYDVVSDLHAPDNFRLAIGCGIDEQGSTTRTFSKKSCLKTAVFFGLSDETALACFEKMEQTVKDSWEETFQSAGFSAKEIEAYAGVFARGR